MSDFYLARKCGRGGGGKPVDSLAIVSKTVTGKAICMWRKRENSSDIGEKMFLAKSQSSTANIRTSIR